MPICLFQPPWLIWATASQSMVSPPSMAPSIEFGCFQRTRRWSTRQRQVLVAGSQMGTEGGRLAAERGSEPWSRSTLSEWPSSSLSASFASEGKGVAEISSPSSRPSSSLSGSSGEAPAVASAWSGSPSRSLSRWFGSVPAAISAALPRPSPSASALASARAGLRRCSISSESLKPSPSESVAVSMIWMPWMLALVEVMACPGGGTGRMKDSRVSDWPGPLRLR